MDQDLFNSDYRNRKKSSEVGSDNLFGWTVFILLLIGFAFASWIGSYYIFGRPENPTSYEILKKLKKVEPPKRFELTAAPNGEFLTAQNVFDRYATTSRLDLEKENSDLMRAFLRNYDGMKRLVPYAIGRYNIVASYELTQNDVFPSGMVALAQSVDNPQVLIEHVFTADEKDVPSLKKLLPVGLSIHLKKTVDLSAVIQVRKLESGHIQITCVPLVYGSYTLGNGGGRFSLKPPPDLNLAGGFPIVRGERFDSAMKVAAATQRKLPPPPRVASNNPAQPKATPAGPELVRLESPTPTPTATPAPTALAVATPTPRRAAPTPTPFTVAANNAIAPGYTPPQTAIKPAPSVTPTPSVTPVATPGGVPLQPFLTAVSTPTTATTAAKTWRTFDPGRMPIGRLVGVSEAAEMAERGVAGETVYLRGEFSVTASGEYQAILRPKTGAISNMINHGGGTRIIAEFPAGLTPPAEGQTFSRDQERPFQIIDVRRGEDGQLNIYVREVTRGL